MRTPRLLYAALLVSGVAAADAPLDVTIRVLESPRDLPEAVTRRIELPPRAPDVADDRAGPGQSRANDARGAEAEPPGPRTDSGSRGNGRAEMRGRPGGPPGLDRASQARPQGRDFGQSTADEARQRGSRGNGVGHRPHGRGRH